MLNFTAVRTENSKEWTSCRGWIVLGFKHFKFLCWVNFQISCNTSSSLDFAMSEFLANSIKDISPRLSDWVLIRDVCKTSHNLNVVTRAWVRIQAQKHRSSNSGKLRTPRVLSQTHLANSYWIDFSLSKSGLSAKARTLYYVYGCNSISTKQCQFFRTEVNLKMSCS